tara:strand:+ start:3820 stop:4458 length:639 start_codon:yes stop_codon:yes gene_type:complete
MEFDLHHIKNNSSSIHLMDYDAFDPLLEVDRLTEQEKSRMLSFGHEGRRREFVATRVLRHYLFGLKHIDYDEVGAPYIRGEGYLSISHSKGLVGIALNSDYKLGLDLETPRENILDIYPKFLSEQEGSIFDLASKPEITKVWSCKEALYKLAGRKKIIFKTELLLNKDDLDNWNGQIVNPDHDLFVKMDIFDHNNTVVSINSEAVERINRDI